ncbi:MAG: hypothetical protein R2815_01680 [Flavobacteriales bacterium]
MSMIPEHWKARIDRSVRFATPVLALLLIGLVYFLGVRTERTGFVREVLDPGLKRITEPVLNAFRGGVPPVGQIKLSLDSAAMDSLERIAANAISSGWLEPEENALFAGRMMRNDSLHNVVVALRPGAWQASSEPALWPLSIRLSDGDTVMGMQHFDLVPVVDGAPLQAWLMARVLEDQGIPHLRRAFTEVKFRTRRAELYTLHGLPDSLLLAAQGAGTGPLVWYGDELMAATARSGSDAYTIIPPLQSDWLSAPIMLAMGSGAGLNDRAAPRQQTAVRALEEFRSGRRKASEVFDVDGLGMLLALSDLLGAQRSMEWGDLRFMLHGASDKLITIPLEYGPFEAIGTILPLVRNGSMHYPPTGTSFADRLFQDPIFRNAYFGALDSISAPGWLEVVLARIGPELDLQERIVAGQLPGTHLDRGILEHDRKVIRQALHPEHVALAYIEDRIGPVDRVAIGNVHALPITVAAFIANNDTITMDRERLIQPRDRDKPLNYSILHLTVPPDHGPPTHVLVRIPGASGLRPVTVRKWNTFPSN